MLAAKRAEEGTTPNLAYEGKIFTAEHTSSRDALFLQERFKRFEKHAAVYREEISKKEKVAIKIELPDGSIKEGTSFETTPLDVARGISNALAKSVCVARVSYHEKINELVVAADEESDDGDECCHGKGGDFIQWDASRPLEASCKLKLIKFEDEEGRNVFWHSSSHVLGEALEVEFGVHLTIGPALDRGFYYDCYMGKDVIKEDMYAKIEQCVQGIVREAQPFERIAVTKQAALDIFSDNPFKVQLITNKVLDGQMTSIYRCGQFVDLCRGPHLPTTEMIRAFSVEKHSAAYWLGKAKNDSLQRVYAISFPDVRQMKAHQKFMAQAKERDHRVVGTKLQLYFFESNLTPGSAFWFPNGAKIYNKLVNLMKREYTIRGFEEVISPNIYSAELFKISGHYQNYQDCMYMFECEGKEWGLKPMNCPGHCLMFKQHTISYKDLPLKLADFGVLHRNEFSGSLSGLTRVRRFCQDDAHIFCREDQLQTEVLAALEFLQYVYQLFGFEFDVALSTRPKKALGELALWQNAEKQLEQALDASKLPWKLNPGDGAFYGPKIDIRLKDCMGRYHQCGTVQVDFQLPLRFDLSYRTHEYGTEAAQEAAKEADRKTEAETAKVDITANTAEATEVVSKAVSGSLESKLKPGTARPVIVHRAILGSLERFSAILVEHFGAKFPFWLSPRQIKVLPISEKSLKYAEYVFEQFQQYGFDVVLDRTDNTINKKVKIGQMEHYNYMFIVGEQEMANGTVTVRSRDDPNKQRELKVKELLDELLEEGEPCSRKPQFREFKFE